MACIAGVDIPNDKRVVISLTYVYGIGLATSKKKFLVPLESQKMFVYVILHQIEKMLSVVKWMQSKLKVTFVEVNRTS